MPPSCDDLLIRRDEATADAAFSGLAIDTKTKMAVQSVTKIILFAILLAPLNRCSLLAFAPLIGKVP